MGTVEQYPGDQSVGARVVYVIVGITRPAAGIGELVTGPAHYSM